MIYFDQAATSFPKPPEVIDSMVEAMATAGANPGRGSHGLTQQTSSLINKTREKASQLFGSSNPNKCLFFQNATVALNQAIKGIDWNKGDHIITTSFEHNSVRRPVEFLKKEYEIDITYINWNEDKDAFLNMINDSITEKTKLITMTHASNVTGTVLPLKEVMELAKNKNVLTLVDASQSAGHIPIHMKEEHIDMLVIPGHKGLLGPQGIGMLLIEGDIKLQPLHHGGTGIDSENIEQPNKWPERYESGTLNTPGIAGLYAALEKYEKKDLHNVPRETLLARQLISSLNKIKNITCYNNMEKLNIPIVAFNINNVKSQEIALILDTHYNIAVRAGLHCSPLAHKKLETIEQGVIRVSLSEYNTEEEINIFLRAIEEVAVTYAQL